MTRRSSGRSKATAADVTGVTFSPDGHTVATASQDHTIRLWDVARGWEIGTLRGHQATVNSVAFSPDGKRVASASSDRSVILWDVANCQVIQTLTGPTLPVTSVAFSPNGKWLASGGGEAGKPGEIRLWLVKIPGRPPLPALPTKKPISSHSVAFSPG